MYLRPITMDDTERIVGWRNSDRVRENFIFQKPFTVQGHIEWMETKVASGKWFSSFCVKQKGTGLWEVFISGILTGRITVQVWDFYRGRGCGRKGLRTLAAKGAVCYARDKMGLHKLMLRVFADNTAAVRSYEKAGFVKEAFLKDEIKGNDGYRDLILMACLFPENP